MTDKIDRIWVSSEGVKFKHPYTGKKEKRRNAFETPTSAYQQEYLHKEQLLEVLEGMNDRPEVNNYQDGWDDAIDAMKKVIRGDDA